MRFYARTHKGLVRVKNEDSCYASENPGGFLAVVADGMGGHNAGETASRIAIEKVRKVLEKKAPASLTEDDVKKSLVLANRSVWEQSKKDASLKGMGSTATVAAFSDHKVIIGNVGDSRAYLYRKGKLEQLTTDHSYVQILIEGGYITKEEAQYHPHRNIITRAIGTEHKVEADVLTVETEKGDLLLLCSDGLNVSISDQEIEDILKNGAEKAADQLIEASLTAGGTDNISVVIAEVDGDA